MSTWITLNVRTREPEEMTATIDGETDLFVRDDGREENVYGYEIVTRLTYEEAMELMEGYAKTILDTPHAEGPVIGLHVSDTSDHVTIHCFELDESGKLNQFYQDGGSYRNGTVYASYWKDDQDLLAKVGAEMNGGLKPSIGGNYVGE